MKSRCSKCYEIIDDVDAGFNPSALGLQHNCGGRWETMRCTRARQKKLILKNDFHGTRAVILAREGETAGEAWTRIQHEAQTSTTTAAKVRRIRRALCGHEGCACGVVR